MKNHVNQNQVNEPIEDGVKIQEIVKMFNYATTYTSKQIYF